MPQQQPKPDDSGAQFPLRREPSSLPIRDPRESFRFGGNDYTPAAILPIIEALIAELEGVSDSQVTEHELELEQEAIWCRNALGWIPSARFRVTDVWRRMKVLMVQGHQELYQKVCIELDYCNKKESLRLIDVLSKLGIVLGPADITGSIALLSALWAFLTYSLDKLCRCNERR